MLGFLNLFSGGALTRIAVFALGIMPYITSSIIMQLLAVVIPKIEQWQKQGAVGQKKITQWTRYMTVGLAILQATGIAYQMNNGILFGGTQTQRAAHPELRRAPRRAHRPHHHRRHRGRHVDGRAGHPARRRQRHVDPDLHQRGQHDAGAVRQHQGHRRDFVLFTIVMILGLFMIVAIVFVEQGQRRIPVQFAKRQVGRRMYGGQSTYIPLKVNSAGVIPIIFASSVLYFPVLLSNVIQWEGVTTSSRTTCCSRTTSSTSASTAC